LDRAHLWAALRYVERNPVRARLAERADSFPWSSAAAHTGAGSPPAWLRAEPVTSAFTPEEWAAYLRWDTMAEAGFELRIRTYTGRPAGSREFVAWAELVLGRRLIAQPGGRPRKRPATSDATERGKQCEVLEAG